MRSCVHCQSDPDTWIGSDCPSPWSFLLLEPSAQSKALLSKLKRSIFSASLQKSFAQDQLSQYYRHPEYSIPSTFTCSPFTQKFFQISRKLISPQSFCPTLPADWKAKEKSGCPKLSFTFVGEHLPCGHESHFNEEVVEYLHVTPLEPITILTTFGQSLNCALFSLQINKMEGLTMNLKQNNKKRANNKNKFNQKE